MTLRSIFSLVLLLVPAVTPAVSQIAANLEGRVTDASGAAVSQAEVTLTQAATNVRQRVTSSSSGDFLFTQLTPGEYQLDVTASGFQHLIRAGVTANVGHTTELTLVLTVGNDQQTVNVTADAPPMQAAESDIETHVAGSTVVALPLNSRNFINLTTLAPGVALPPGTVLPRINGGRPRTNDYLYDGISALQPEPGQVAFFPIIDGIAEFTVEADNVPAEFGRFNGGVVNVATRAGGNQFHGSLSEFFRNEALNSRNYFGDYGAEA